MSDTDIERSAEARKRAERALVMLLHEVGDDVPLIVLGGLVPEVLARGDGIEVPEHLGTTDVDVLLITHVRAGGSLTAVERALVATGRDGVHATWRVVALARRRGRAGGEDRVPVRSGGIP